MVPTNARVKTPIGDGVCQGSYAATDVTGLDSSDAESQPVEHYVLVRIPITEENLHLLGSTKCLTPRATTSALFVFAESEVGNAQ